MGSLERIHRGYAQAAAEIEAAIGVPLCVPACGLCCEANSVLALGIESEYAASFLLGRPDLLNPVLDRCREWLTRPGQWTYGRKFTAELYQQLQPEWHMALQSACPFMLEDKRCMVHLARPMVCRAFGVTRMAHRECSRPLGAGEDSDTRAIWKDSAALPLHRWTKELRHAVRHNPMLCREGFLAAMLFQHFRAEELAGLLDDGKVPLIKLTFGWGGTHALLWQEQLEREWSSQAADKSISRSPKMREVGGVPRLVISLTK